MHPLYSVYLGIHALEYNKRKVPASNKPNGNAKSKGLSPKRSHVYFRDPWNMFHLQHPSMAQ